MTNEPQNTNVVNLGRVRRERRERLAQTANAMTLAEAALSILEDNRAARLAGMALRRTMKPRRCHRQTTQALGELSRASVPLADRDVIPIRLRGLDPLDAQQAIHWIAEACKACRRCPLGATYAGAPK